MPVITQLTNQGDVILPNSRLIHGGPLSGKPEVPAVHRSATTRPIAPITGIGTSLASLSIADDRLSSTPRSL